MTDNHTGMSGSCLEMTGHCWQKTGSNFPRLKMVLLCGLIFSTAVAKCSRYRADRVGAQISESFCIGIQTCGKLPAGR